MSDQKKSVSKKSVSDHKKVGVKKSRKKSRCQIMISEKKKKSVSDQRKSRCQIMISEKKPVSDQGGKDDTDFLQDMTPTFCRT